MDTGTTKILLSTVIVLVAVSFPVFALDQNSARKQLQQLGYQLEDVEQFTDNARRGQIRVVKLFIDAGVKVNAPNKIGETALYSAAHEGHIEIVEALLTSGADVKTLTNVGSTVLESACSRNRRETQNNPRRIRIVRALLDRGADPNVPGWNGGFALHVA